MNGINSTPNPPAPFPDHANDKAVCVRVGGELMMKFPPTLRGTRESGKVVRGFGKNYTRPTFAFTSMEFILATNISSDNMAFKIPTNLRALVFDVDGTLYRQKPVQRAMLKKLLLATISNPIEGVKTLKIISAFRQSQEHIREQNIQTEDLARAQLQHAALKLGYAEDDVRRIVEKWMESAPLPVLAQFLQLGIREFLNEAKNRNIHLAVCSDYPALDKLKAMGLAGYFNTIISAQDREVGVFKPDPKGLLLALECMGVSADESLYIGDRADVDSAAAFKAGLNCVLVTQKILKSIPPKTRVLHDFKALQHLLFSSP